MFFLLLKMFLFLILLPYIGGMLIVRLFCDEKRYTLDCVVSAILYLFVFKVFHGLAQFRSWTLLQLEKYWFYFVIIAVCTVMIVTIIICISKIKKIQLFEKNLLPKVIIEIFCVLLACFLLRFLPGVVENENTIGIICELKNSNIITTNDDLADMSILYTIFGSYDLAANEKIMKYVIGTIALFLSWCAIKECGMAFCSNRKHRVLFYFLVGYIYFSFYITSCGLINMQLFKAPWNPNVIFETILLPIVYATSFLGVNKRKLGVLLIATTVFPMVGSLLVNTGQYIVLIPMVVSWIIIIMRGNQYADTTS